MITQSFLYPQQFCIKGIKSHRYCLILKSTGDIFVDDFCKPNIRAKNALSISLFLNFFIHTIGFKKQGESFMEGNFDIIVTTSWEIPGYEIQEYLGLVWGITVRSRNIGADITAGCRNIVGGEVKSYTIMSNEARDQAVQRLVENAQKLGANAVIRVTFDSSSSGQGMTEIMAYGTAVKVQRK